MKGFRVLHAACAMLWKKRQDFELVATSDPLGQVDPMTRFIGWQPQSELPKYSGEQPIFWSSRRLLKRPWGAAQSKRWEPVGQ